MSSQFADFVCLSALLSFWLIFKLICARCYTISGISCGARFSHSYLLSYSSEIDAAYLNAGIPILNLTINDTKNIHDITTLANTSTVFNYWHVDPPVYDVDDIISWIYYLEENQFIDPLSNLLQNTKIHIYHGSLDWVASSANVKNLQLLYNTILSKYISLANKDESLLNDVITTDIDDKNLPHMWYSPYATVSCSDTNLNLADPFMCRNDINYDDDRDSHPFDTPSDIFKLIFSTQKYGDVGGNVKDGTKHRPLNVAQYIETFVLQPTLNGSLVLLDISGYLKELEDDFLLNKQNPNVRDKWDLFIPFECVKDKSKLNGIEYIDPEMNNEFLANIIGNGKCDLHIAFHGGNMSPTRLGQIFSRFNGLNDWASVNNIIVLYPSVKRSVINFGCWDYWGYTGKDWYHQNGAQIKIVHKIADTIVSAVNKVDDVAHNEL